MELKEKDRQRIVKELYGRKKTAVGLSVGQRALVSRRQIEFQLEQEQDPFPKEPQQFKEREHLRDLLPFVQPQIEDLQALWQSKWYQPWYVPVELVREYYGEKIAIYFMFLGYYCRQLLGISVIGLCVGIAQISLQNDLVPRVLSEMIFGIMSTVWGTLTMYGWLNKEKEFAVQYGLLSSSLVEEDSTKERPKFVGSFQRSVIDDNLNSQQQSQREAFIKTFISISGVTFFLFLYFWVNCSGHRRTAPTHSSITSSAVPAFPEYALSPIKSSP